MAIRMSTTFQQAPMRVQDEIQDAVLRRGGSQELARVVLAANEHARNTEDTNRALRATIDRLRAELKAALVDAEKYKFVLSGLSMEFAICEYDAHLNQWYQPSTPKAILSEIIGNAMRTGEPKV